MTSSAQLDDVKNMLVPLLSPEKGAADKAAKDGQAGDAAKVAVNGATAGGEGGAPEPGAPFVPDFERLAQNTARFIEQGGKAVAAFLKPFETGTAARKDMATDTVAIALRSIGKIAEHWMSDPARLAEAQSAISTPFLQLWAQTYRRMKGEKVDPIVPVPKGDKRFVAPEWAMLPLYDFLRQAHALGARWADDLVERSTDIDPREKAKARFYLKQITSAVSPANFLATNPELTITTFASHGENLVKGAEILAEDMEAGKGALRIRQTDASKFELGVNIATTPGKVVYRNDLIELIQYTPMTETVRKRPLMIVPPWINKFYIIDLNPEKSFIRYAVEQGTTVFVLSWVNPDGRHRAKTFEAYMREGIFDALEAIRAATGEEQVDAIGYCVGGTLLAATLAFMAAKDDKRIASGTFFAAQADFSDAGDIQVFIDDEQVQILEDQMSEKGYLDGSRMSMAFNMLRPNELLWTYVVNNYVKGIKPPPFDLLFWNSDSTRLPALNHSFYLRNFYIENKLAKGEMVIGGQRLDLGQVTVPTYFLATKDDHIAPAASVFRGAKLFGGDVRYVLGGSGHIAGVINPPTKDKYGYWVGPRPAGTLEEWRTETEQRQGSWWPDWQDWLSAQAPERVSARIPGSGELSVLGDAPGDYVRATN